DFGLALFREEGGLREGTTESPELTRTGQRLGTAHYMAPEQCLDSRDVDFRTDIYSLGVILFELLTARPPFVGDQAQVVQAHVVRYSRSPHEHGPGAPEYGPDRPWLSRQGPRRALPERRGIDSSGAGRAARGSFSQSAGRDCAGVFHRPYRIGRPPRSSKRRP